MNTQLLITEEGLEVSRANETWYDFQYMSNCGTVVTSIGIPANRKVEEVFAAFGRYMAIGQVSPQYVYDAVKTYVAHGRIQTEIEFPLLQDEAYDLIGERESGLEVAHKEERPWQVI